MEKMNTPQADILAKMTGTENPSKDNTMLVSRQQWEESPLTICSIEEGNKWFLALGTKRLTEYYPEKTYVELLLTNQSWQLLIQIMVAVAEDTHNYINEQKNKEYQEWIAATYGQKLK